MLDGPPKRKCTSPRNSISRVLTAKPYLSKSYSFYTVRFETAAFLTKWCGALKLKLSRISIEGHHSQTQTDGQLRSISGQTVRDRTESVEFFFLSEDQAEKMRYVEAKSDQYERSYVCLKFNSILSRATREQSSPDSYELCRLVAQPLVIRFCSNISYFLPLVLT